MKTTIINYTMKSKSILRLWLFAIIICTVSAAKAHDFEVDGIYYNITSSKAPFTVAVTYRGEVGYSGYAYTGCVIIPDSVTYSGNTYSVTSIGMYALYNCTGLASVSIPESVISIGEGAFEDCSGLTKAEFANIESLCGIQFITKSSNPLSIAHHLFVDGSEVTDLVIPESVSSIEGYTFQDCSGLTSVTIGNSVTSIGEYAFRGCSGLTSVTIDNSVTNIGEYAFSGCSGLTSVTIPNSVTSIGGGAFSGCNGLASVSIPNSVISIGSGAFYGTAWYNNQPDGLVYAGKVAYKYKGTMQAGTTIELEDGTLGIAGDTFSGCSGLTSVTIPNSVTSIGSDAFYGCSGLTSVSIPESVTSIGRGAFSGTAWYNNQPNGLVYAGKVAYKYKGTMQTGTTIALEDGTLGIAGDTFSGCSGLTSVTIPNSVTSIGSYAFSGCSGLTSVTIPNSLTSIGSYAFYGCSGLTSVTIGNGVTGIDSYAFFGCSGLTSVTIPENVTSIGSWAFYGCNSLAQVEFASIEGLCNMRFGNYLANPLYYAHHLYIGGNEVTNLVIPEGVTSIGSYAFWDCSGLTSVTIPESVASIGSYAFRGCSGLAQVEFASIEGLCNMRFGNYSANPLSITHHFSVGGNEVKDLAIPNSVTSIGSFVFYGCSGLASVTIPNSVTSIGKAAFIGCSGLPSITIPENVIDIGKQAFYGCNAYVYCFPTIPPGTTSPFETSTIIIVPDESLEAYKTAWPQNADKLLPVGEACRYVDVEAKVTSSAVVESIGEEHARNVIALKVRGSINGYDLMVFRNKMVNLRELDLSQATVESCNYKYFENFNSKENTVTGHFVPSTVMFFKFPQGITALEANAFYNCSRLQGIDLPNRITTIPNSSFYNCSSLRTIIIPNSVTSIDNSAFQNCMGLTSIVLPESVTAIGNQAFLGCSRLRMIHLPKDLETIGDNAFGCCSSLHEMHLPPYLNSIGSNVFSGASNLNSIYAYMPSIVPIGQNTFSTYQTATLYVPEFLYNSYYYDTQWSQFLNVMKTSLKPDDYITLPANGDIVFDDDDERIPDTSGGEHIDGEVGDEGGVTVIGDDPQPFDEVDQDVDGDGTGGSLIGDDDGENQGNLPVNRLRVRITVQPNRWYFFCFPWDVIISECTYPGQYVWRQYDGLIRAMEGANGWQPVTGDRLEALHGYIFQSSKGGKLILTFDHPTFGGDRPINLTPYISGNKQDESWNFVGNPYSCYYDFQEDDYSAPITVWNGSSYQAYRPGDDDYHLRPYEAFFVQKPNAESQINFEPDRRETYLTSQATAEVRREMRRARGIDPKRQLVNLHIMDSEGLQLDRTRVVFNGEANTAYELECDAAKFMSSGVQAQLYSLEAGVAMSINERPLQGDIRLGYTAKKTGTLSISASRMDKPMVLIDTEMGTTFDLALGSYDFQTKAGINNTRFLLRENTEATGIVSLAKKTGVVIGTQTGGLAIGGAEGKTVNVFTTSGAQVAQHTGNGFIALQRGIYVAEIDGQSAKIAVK